MKSILSFVLSILFSVSCKTRSLDESNLMQESEDRETEYTKNLVDVDETFVEHVNTVIRQCRTSLNLSNASNTPKRTKADQIVYCVFNQLGLQIKETGFGPMKVAPLCKIEVWMMQRYREDKSEIVTVPREKTRYGRNKTGMTQIGRTPVFGRLSTSGAKHTIVATIRMKGVLIGIDKWAHFFTTGYHIWQQPKLRADQNIRTMVYRWLEGDNLSDEEITKYRTYIVPMKDYHILGATKYGVLGAWSTGIISNADMYANEEGFTFYEKLSKDPESFEFSLDQIDLTKLNEVENPSKFVPGMKVDP